MRGDAGWRCDIDFFVLVEEAQATAQQTVDEITPVLNEESFAGDRYIFRILVESVEIAPIR